LEQLGKNGNRTIVLAGRGKREEACSCWRRPPGFLNGLYGGRRLGRYVVGNANDA